MESVMVKERAEAEMQAKAAAKTHKAQMETAMARSLQATSAGEVTGAAQVEAELLAQVESTDDEEQLTKTLAESQADNERQKLAQEADHCMTRMVMEASELDAEQRKAEEDKVAAVVSESKRAAEVCEAIATEEAIRLAWSNDPETVVQMRAQVAGLPTQDTEEFKEKIAELEMKELNIPSDGDCFYHAVNASLAGTKISSSMTADELRKYSAVEAVKRGDIDEAEAERRSEQGRLVTYEEVQAAATTLRCRIVIYHARK
jgi:hypothetical protein